MITKLHNLTDNELVALAEVQLPKESDLCVELLLRFQCALDELHNAITEKDCVAYDLECAREALRSVKP